MYCTKCGSKLSDGSKFCSACGTKVPIRVAGTAYGQNRTGTSALAPEVFSGISEQGIGQYRRKSWPKIAVLAAAVLAVVFGLKGIFFGSGDGDQAYVCFSQNNKGEYLLINDLKRPKIKEIALSQSYNTAPGALAFSPDGKYIYYLIRYDYQDETGTLCRTEYGKLKENLNKNQEYMETIDTNVCGGFEILDDGSVIYRKNGEDALCLLFYFNGETSVKLAEGVSTYYTDKSDRILYTTREDSRDYTLYGANLDKPDQKIRLASHMAAIFPLSDFDNILYAKYHEDSSASLYVTGFEKEEKELADNLVFFSEIGGKSYFANESGEMFSYYDFVEDDYADSDAGITEPNPYDFSVPVYRYQMISNSNLSEENYGELYTSCTKALYWFGETALGPYSMYESFNRNWGSESEAVAIRTATEEFIERFASTANAEGFIPVTDEVREALQKINRAGNEDSEKWLWFCYTKYPSGTTADYDAYNAALDQWNRIKDRVRMRELLQDTQAPLQTLYCFDKGTVTKVDDGIMWGNPNDFNEGVILAFPGEGMRDKVIRIEEISSFADVEDALNRRATEWISVILPDGTVCGVSDSAVEGMDILDNYEKHMFYFTNKELYMWGVNGALSMAEIRNGIVGEFVPITDETIILTVDESTLYYVKRVPENTESTGNKYFDLYSCINGKSTCLARKVLFENINIYSDGVILAYTDHLSGTDRYEVTMFDSKGKATLIGQNITQYIRVDESTLLYLDDGDLYVYDGKKRTIVSNDIERIWSKNAMKTEYTLNWWEYMSIMGFYNE